MFYCSYRGLNQPLSLNYKEGSTVYEHSFTSTSIYRSVATNFANRAEAKGHPNGTMMKLFVKTAKYAFKTSTGFICDDFQVYQAIQQDTK
jgi:hypothetical protein